MVKNEFNYKIEIDKSINYIEELKSSYKDIDTDVLNIAIQALEKQLAKPIIRALCSVCTKTTCDDKCSAEHNRCPRCGKSLDNEYDEEFEHCCFCGQRLKY